MSCPAGSVEVPLEATLARLAARNPYLAYEDGDAGGTPTDRLGDEGAPVLAAAVGSAAADGATLPRVQAAWFVHRYAWMLAAPAVGCLVAEERLPCLDTHSTTLHVGGDGLGWRVGLRNRTRLLGLAGDAAVGAQDPVGEAAALTRLLRAALESHLDEVLALEPLRCLGRRARWLLAADACVGAVLDVTQELADLEQAVAAAATFTAAPGPFAVPVDLVPADDGSGAMTRWRSSCCLAYHVDGLGKCATCPLVRRAR